MATLTSSSTVTIGAGSVVVEQAEVTILPAVAGGDGNGRLIHPTLGTLDYEHAPDEWVNIDGDVIVAPIWSSAKTLIGAAHALWQGNLRDVPVSERWSQELNVSVSFLRQLLAFWMNPPDPEEGPHVQWWPNYASELGFNVAIINVQVGGAGGITLNGVARFHEWVTEPITINLRVLSRVE